MNLSKTTEYAIRILSYMAIDEAKLYTAKQINQKLMISDKYLRRIMTELSKQGFIRSIQGRDGGYRFAKSIKSIFLIDIINAIEKDQAYKECVLGFEGCTEENPCALHAILGENRNNMFEKLSATSLNHIVNKNINWKY